MSVELVVPIEERKSLARYLGLSERDREFLEGLIVEDIRKEATKKARARKPAAKRVKPGRRRS